MKNSTVTLIGLALVSVIGIVALSSKKKVTKTRFFLQYDIRNDDQASHILAFLDKHGQVESMDLDDKLSVVWITETELPNIPNQTVVSIENV